MATVEIPGKLNRRISYSSSLRFRSGYSSLQQPKINDFIARSGRSYLDVVRSTKLATKQAVEADSFWRRKARFVAFSTSPCCFRCGGSNHYTRDCREPVRCFLCGMNGHKRYNYSREAPSLNVFVDNHLKRGAVDAELNFTKAADCFLNGDSNSCDLPEKSLNPTPTEMELRKINDASFTFNLNFLKLRCLLMHSTVDIGAFEYLEEVRKSVDCLHSHLLPDAYLWKITASTVTNRSDLAAVHNVPNRFDEKDSSSCFDYFYTCHSEGWKRSVSELLYTDDTLLLDPDVMGCTASCIAETYQVDAMLTEDAQVLLHSVADTEVDYSSFSSDIDSRCEVDVVGYSTFVAIPALVSYATARGVELANRYSVLEELDEAGQCANGLPCCFEPTPVKDSFSEEMIDYYENAVSISNEVLALADKCMLAVAKDAGFFMAASTNIQSVPIINDCTQCSVSRGSDGFKMVGEVLNTVAQECDVLPLDYSFAKCITTYD